jgi:transcriptional regulator with XRE-family HTH domain
VKKTVRVAPGWGAVVRRLREERGWSQGELAYHAGVDQSQISKIETGAQDDARLSTAVGLAGALGVGLDALLGRRPLGPPVGGVFLEQIAQVVRGVLAEERADHAHPHQQTNELGHAGLPGADYRYLNDGVWPALGRLVRAAAPVP